MKTRPGLPFLALSVLAFGCGGSTNATPPGVPVSSVPATSSKMIEAPAEPHHHLALENRYVRALRVVIDPNSATLKHLHGHDYVNVTMAAAELSNEVDGKPPAAVKLQEGQVRFVEGRGPAHLVRNVGTTPYRNMTIELLEDGANQAVSAKWAEDHGVASFEGGSREILFAKDGVRVSKVDLRPGGALPKQPHAGPYFVVAVTDLDLQDDVEGRGAHAVQLKSGEAKWEDGGPYRLTNIAKQPAKVVLLEFK